uniref:Uncharacterized protein n=1 Tax=viral metagenome TaxID=1070528 RepID=A0A6H2A5G5_9ZZZZ
MTDFEYESGRNRLIPLAEQKANREHGKYPPGNREQWVRSWNVCFLGEMNRLAKEVGLIK